MKIYDTNFTGAAAQTGRPQETQRAPRDGGSASGAVSGEPRDRVELSGSLSSLGRALASDRSGRAAKVQALAAQYRSGAYQADSLATSRAMVASALTAQGRP